MRKEEFIALMDAPEKIAGENVALLDGLVSEYPYFQTAQVLLAKALSNDNSIRYEEQLKIAAAYAADRKALHRLIMHAVNESEVKPAGKEEIPLPAAETEEIPSLVEKPKTDITPEPVNEEKEITPEPVKEEKEIVSEPAEEVTARPEAKEEVKTEDIPSSSEAEEIIPLVPELPPLEQNIIVKAIDASIELEVSETMPFKETEETLETEKPETQETEKPETRNSKPETLNPKPETLNPKPETLNSDPETSETGIDPDAKLSFSEWLKYAKKAKAAEVKTPKIQDRQNKEEAQPGEKEEKKKPKTRRTIDDLIDKFIAEEPKITRPQAKQEFFSPMNMAKQSVEDDNEYVTETLANIYLKQGSYAKAIKTYETLSLKFPEKKLYFAARIKEIKKIIKEQK